MVRKLASRACGAPHAKNKLLRRLVFTLVGVFPNPQNTQNSSVAAPRSGALHFLPRAVK